jgi:hypothetical protein
MPSFPYVARTSQGTLERGTIDAETAKQARERLHRRGLTVEELGDDSTIGLSETPSWTVTGTSAKAAKTVVDKTEYIPLLQTLRLFAGWLMAWYGIIFLAGSYRADGRIPYDIPAIEGLAASPLVLRFAFGTFLFLALTDLHKKAGSKAIIGIALAIVGVGLMWVFHLNV